MYIFYVGVPLFMMLTGYLNANKTPTKQYYRGMVRVLVAYLVFSVITILFRKYYLGEEYTWLHWGMKILNYTGIPYAWYIEMWIGLALLTPFLNYMYKAIPSKKQKILLLVTLFVMTSLPKFLNRSGLDVIPAYYEQALYPLMYYFLGNFIREYKPRVKFWQGCVIVLSIALVTPIVSLLHLAGPNILWLGGGPDGIFCFLIALVIFIMLYNKDITSTQIKRWVTHCSLVSLEMYLCCYMFDKLYYPYFLERFFQTQSQFFLWFFIIVPMIFISSYVVASIYRLITSRIVLYFKYHDS